MPEIVYSDLMVLNELKLTDFRSYSKVNFEFGAGINVVIGKNASGKTNILEAVYLLSTGNSIKAKVIDEMVGFGQELGRVEGKVEEVGDLQVVVTRGIVSGTRTMKRKYLVDGVSKRKGDYLGLLPAVIFRPEDMDTLTGGPDLRRRFLDDVLCQVSPEYVRSLASYTQALRRRNRLLEVIRDGSANRLTLVFWDGLLIKHGEVISRERERLAHFINSLWNKSELFNNLKFVYDRSLINKERLTQYQNEELAAGYTLVGPHRDDFWIDQKERNLATYGSRGEQRMVVLALKLGEIYFLEESIGGKPLLLLDDIFSELDEIHKKEVLRVMIGRQVIVTTANKEDLLLFKDPKIISL